MTERTAIQFNDNTLEMIQRIFPRISANYTVLELQELCSKREYLVTNPEKWYDFMIFTEQELLVGYGSTSPKITETFVKVTKVA